MTDYGRTDEALARLTPALRADYFKGKTVLVSGAGSGLGRGIAHWVARLGGNVVLCGRKEDKLNAARDAVAQYGGETLVHAMSIRDPDAVEALFAKAYERFGAVDLVVNNAGGQFPTHAIDIPYKGWNAVIDTNLNGTWLMMQAAAKRWRDAAQPGSIVNIIAVVGRGMPGVAHTAAARAGVVALSKTVAIEWAPLDIRINCVAPGAIATEGMDVYSEEARSELPRSNLMKRFGEATDVADAVTYLIAPSGSFITGEVVVVDGGNQVWGDQWTIPRPDYFAGTG